MRRLSLRWVLVTVVTMAASTSAVQATSVACPAQPPMRIAVFAEHHPPAVLSSYSYPQLREMAARAGHDGPHEPFGLYAGTFGYSVDVQAADDGHAGCVTSMSVTVRMLLGDRRVEIGTDGPCRPEAVAAHYLLHAGHDDRLLTQYGSQALAMFDRMPHADLLGTPGQDGDRDAVAAVVRGTMDDLLRSYDDDRARALASADNADELASLQRACGQAT